MTHTAVRPLKDMDSTELTNELLDVVFRTIPGAYRKVASAAVAASFLHRNQTRANRGRLARTPYLEHPLRVALRALRWGVTSEAVLVAAILHDTLEDCVDDILRFILEIDPSDLTEIEKLSYATEWIIRDYGQEAADIVRAVTNDTLPSGLTRTQKNEFYIGHVTTAISGEPGVFIVKFSDYMDNGAGLYHNNVPGNEGMVRRLATKYRPLPDIFETVFEANPTMSGLLAAHGTAEVRTKISSSRDRLDVLLAA